MRFSDSASEKSTATDRLLRASMGHQTCLTLSPPKLRILDPPAHSRTVTEAPKSPKSAAANAAAGD